MTRVHTVAVLTAAILTCFVQSLSADVKADERGLVKFEGGLGKVVGILGGRAAREGVKSTIAVKGDRKITTTDANGQIVDLAEEKIYELDVRKKTYTVMTFAELRRRMEEARKKAEADAAKVKEAGRGAARSEGQGDRGRLQRKETASAVAINRLIRIRRS
jgi:hypothetical protein